MSKPRSTVAEVLNPLPVQLGLARTRRIPSGVAVMGPEKNIRIRLPKDCDAYTFLKKVFAHQRIDMHTRMAAAIACLPYEKPRLIAIAPASTNPGEQRLVITGGLPPRPRPAACSPSSITRLGLASSTRLTNFP
jgi:hypothetical protein